MWCGAGQSQEPRPAGRAPTSSRHNEVAPLSLRGKLCLEPCETSFKFMTSKRGLAYVDSLVTELQLLQGAQTEAPLLLRCLLDRQLGHT